MSIQSFCHLKEILLISFLLFGFTVHGLPRESRHHHRHVHASAKFDDSASNERYGRQAETSPAPAEGTNAEGTTVEVDDDIDEGPGIADKLYDMGATAVGGVKNIMSNMFHGFSRLVGLEAAPVPKDKAQLALEAKEALRKLKGGA